MQRPVVGSLKISLTSTKLQLSIRVSGSCAWQMQHELAIVSNETALPYR